MPVGESIGTAYVRIIANGDGLDESVEKEFRKAEPKVKKAGQDHANAYDKGWRDEDGKNADDRLKALVESLEKGDNKFEKLGTLLSSDMWDGLQKGFEDKTHSHALSAIITKNLKDDFTRSGGDFEKLGKTIENDFSRLVADAGKELEALGHDMDNSKGPFDRLIKRVDGISDSTSRAFGKGSRNDFLNFVGVFVGGIAAIPTVLLRATKGISEFGEKIADVGEAGEGLEGLATTGAEAGVSMGELAVSGLSAGVALGIVAAIIPVAVSTMTLLLGVVDALVGSIGIGLVGGLVIAGAAFAPLILGAGVLYAGILKLNEAGNVMADAFKPLRVEIDRLRDISADAILKNFVPAVKNLAIAAKPAIKGLDGIADAASGMLLTLSKSINTDTFEKGFGRFETFSVGALTRIGNIIDHTLGGLGGLFVAAIPAAERFLHDMDNLTSKFSDFTNSAEGQNKLEDFFNRAYDSLTSLGHLLRDSTKLIGALAGAGQSSGDTIIDHLDSKVRDFTAYLKANPKVVANFFGDVTDFADGVGNVTLAIIKLIDKLDSPSSRKNAIGLFNAVADGVGFATDAIQVLIDIITPFIAIVEGLANQIALPFRIIYNLLTGDIYGAISDIIGIFGDFLHVIGSIGSAFGKIPGVPDLGKPFNAAADAVQRLQDHLDGKPIKPHVDTSEMDKILAVAHTTDESLRILLGLPKIEPKVDPKQLLGATTDTQLLINAAEKFRNSPTIVARLNRQQVLDGKLALLQGKAALVDFNSKAAKSIQIKINSTQAAIAKNAVSGLLDALHGVLNIRDKTIRINTVYGSVGKPPSARGGISDGLGGVYRDRMALGGIANFQQMVNGLTVGEAGREAIVPLDKPLGEVDPSVRYLAAIARGQNPGGGNTVNNNLTVVTPTTNPRAVAVEAINALTAQAV